MILSEIGRAVIADPIILYPHAVDVEPTYDRAARRTGRIA
jgi:hypothetical protein